MKKFKAPYPRTLLSVNADSKTIKGRKRRYLTGILYLAPYNLSGYQVCPGAKRAGCHRPCLNLSGKGGMPRVQLSRIRKTKLFFEQPDWFMPRLHADVEALRRKASTSNMKPCVRLNGTSDINWEGQGYTHGGVKYANLMQAFPSVQFYDYSKHAMQVKEPNHHLTFSYSAAPEFQKLVDKALKLQMNLAVVFSDTFPEQFLGRRVVSGETDDLRFLDPAGVVIGLKAKGPARKQGGTFVVDSNLIAMGG